MILTIHQPQYIPWIGYFDKIDKADKFVILDDVQYKKNEWQNRNKVRAAKGGRWFTVPVIYKFGQKINEVKIDNSKNWRKKHYKTLIINYNKTPYFKNHEPFFRKSYECNWEYLVDINIHFIKYLIKSLGITTKLMRSSSLAIKGQRTERLVEICKKLEANTYISGEGARAYLDLSRFKQSKIEVIFQNFQHPIYTQAYDNFEPFMSVVDLLFNCGDESLKVLRGESNKNI
ncbi:MAG: WbqC family protein [Candidatus Omnitrophica bacterium]|nr:WbqC family protein [Candidatus Omnitrophota bacterium]